MQAGCYSLDLYCDLNEIAAGEVSDGIHQYREFPHQFTDELGSRCRSDARKSGWKLSRDGGQDLCPKCNPASRKYVAR